jgi:hypothetical protein
MNHPSVLSSPFAVNSANAPAPIGDGVLSELTQAHQELQQVRSCFESLSKSLEGVLRPQAPGAAQSAPQSVPSCAVAAGISELRKLIQSLGCDIADLQNRIAL